MYISFYYHVPPTQIQEREGKKVLIPTVITEKRRKKIGAPALNRTCTLGKCLGKNTKNKKHSNIERLGGKNVFSQWNLRPLHASTHGTVN
jgi:hypothetical protein